jgi:hypothetical protein
MCAQRQPHPKNSESKDLHFVTRLDKLAKRSILMKLATPDQIETIRRRSYNQTARDMQQAGVKLTWAQAHALGDQAIDWMRSRLGLKSVTSDHGVTFKPDSRAHATMRGAVTDSQIRALRREAASAGDHAQALLCDLALGTVVLDEDTPIEALRIARFLSPEDKRRISAMDPEDYREECVLAIEGGQG